MASSPKESGVDEHLFVKGCPIYLSTNPGALSRTTGWRTWQAANVTIRYIESHYDLEGQFVLDISSGNGLVAIACAALGAEVVATEINSCLPLLQHNVRLNSEKAILNGSISTMELAWGKAVDHLPAKVPQLTIISDLLYIAIRDNLEDPLYETLTEAINRGKEMLLCYEERMPKEEDAFVDRLRRVAVVSEVPTEELDFRDCVEESEGEFDGLATMMWEPPPIRLFILRQMEGNSS